jgi:hypothetical protein
VPRIGTQPLADQPLGGLPSTNDPRPQPLPWPPASAGRQVPTFHTRAQTKLAPPPRRTPPGQSAGTRQAHPGALARPRFRCHLSRSTRHQRFTHVRLLGPHLTRSMTRLFPQRSAPRLLTDAPCGGLRPPPAGRPRSPRPHGRFSISDAAPHPAVRSSKSRLLQRSWSHSQAGFHGVSEPDRSARLAKTRLHRKRDTQCADRASRR